VVPSAFCARRGEAAMLSAATVNTAAPRSPLFKITDITCSLRVVKHLPPPERFFEETQASPRASFFVDALNSYVRWRGALSRRSIGANASGTSLSDLIAIAI
jgi:hypothetical protein